MSPSRSRLLISLLALAACDDDPTCGSLGAPPSGMLVAGGGVSLEFGEFTSGANNDCPDLAIPIESRTTSVTIFAKLAGGSPGFLTACLQHPESSNTTGRDIGADQSEADIQIVDVTAMTGGCTYTLSNAAPPTGLGQTEGSCDNGTNPAGFALVLDGMLKLDKTCGANPVEVIDVTLSGRVAVTPQ